MAKRFLHQRHMEEREMEIEQNIQNTERLRKEREQVLFSQKYKYL